LFESGQVGAAVGRAQMRAQRDSDPN
jgi:hypothetical protein